jgi:hypothetical protein
VGSVNSSLELTLSTSSKEKPAVTIAVTVAPLISALSVACEAARQPTNHNPLFAQT